MQKTIFYLLIAVFFTLCFNGCATIDNYNAINKQRRIESTPSGANFTISLKEGQIIQYYTIHTTDGRLATFGLSPGEHIKMYRGVDEYRFTLTQNTIDYTISKDWMIYFEQNVYDLPDNTRFNLNNTTYLIRKSRAVTDAVSGVTPRNVDWRREYGQVRFELSGYPPQTAQLRRTEFNPWYLMNFLIIGIGAWATSVDPEGVDPVTGSDYSGTQDWGYILLGGGILSFIVDTVTGSFLTYPKTITADMTRKPRAPSPRRTEIRQGIETTVEQAIVEAMTNVPRNSIIAMDQVSGGDAVLRAFITSETEYELVKQGFRVVDRVQWDRIREEQGFQLTDEVDSSTAVNLGRIAGASHIVTGIIEGEGQLRRLRLRVMETQTADLIGTASVPYGDSRLLENPFDVIRASQEAMQQAMTNIARNSKIAIVQVSTDNAILDYVTGESEFLLIQQGYRVVDRTQLDRIRAERRMQISDNFDDRTLTEIGRFLGADYLLTIRADGQGGLTRLRWRVLHTETAIVAGSASIPFHAESTQTNLPENMSAAVSTAIEQAIPNNIRDSVIGIVQISASNNSQRDFVAGESEFILVNRGFRIVDRSQLDKIRAEQNFQRTGEVDDNTAVEIGKISGARYIITGRVDGQGSLARVRLRLLDTETAEVVGAASVAVHQRFSMGDGERPAANLERAIETAINQAMPRVPSNSTIAIVQVTGQNSQFIIGDTEDMLVQRGFRVVDRAQLDRIREEQRLQRTGEIDNATAAQIGRFAGASYIITGSVDGTGDTRRLRLRVLDTQTAFVVGNASVRYNDGSASSANIGIEVAVSRAIEQSLSGINKTSRLAIVQVSGHNVDFVTGESEYLLVNQGYRVVDRAQLDRIRAELRLQVSGEIDDITAREIGRLSGAEYIITIRADGEGAFTRLRWRVLHTETAVVAGSASIAYSGSRASGTPVSIETAISRAIEQSMPSVSPNAKLAIASVTAENRLRDFITGESEFVLVNRGYRVVDRTQLQNVRSELNLQMSGDIDDNTAAQIGRFTGAEYIIGIRADGQGDLRRLRWRVLQLETALVVGSASVPYGDMAPSSASISIERAMETAIQQATQRVTRNTRIAIVQMTAANNTLRNFVAGEAENVLVRQGYRVVDRSQLDRIRTEQRIQLGGDVDDNTAVSIGRIAGAAYILTGRIDGEGDLRRVRLRILNTETAEVAGVASVRFSE